jgi:hypothetical protein
MTMHTYKTILSRDGEYETPISAAMEMHNYLLEMATAMGVGDEHRPIYRVEQFVDTDVPPKVAYVDSLTWRAYADEGCTVLIDEDWFNGKIYNAMSPTARMVSNVEVYDDELCQAIQLLGTSDDVFPLDASNMTYWADVSELKARLEDPGLNMYLLTNGWQRAALLAALTRVEERGAEEVHFHIQ